MRALNFKIIAILFVFLMLLSCHKKSTTVEGYVDADYTYISSNTSANLTKLFVRRGDQVTKDQPLFLLEAQPQKAELQNAQAQLKNINEKMKIQRNNLYYQLNLLKRYQKLFKKQGVSREELEKVENNYKNDEANLKMVEADLQGAKAEVEKAKWNSGTKTIYAPLSGLVYDTFYTDGEFVEGAHAVLALLKPENVKVVFYVPEIFLKSIKHDQKIKINCDQCDTEIPASIKYISNQAEYTPPVIYSEKERTKLVFRVEAKMLTPSFTLKPGQPVNVILNNL